MIYKNLVFFSFIVDTLIVSVVLVLCYCIEHPWVNFPTLIYDFFPLDWIPMHWIAASKVRNILLNCLQESKYWFFSPFSNLWEAYRYILVYAPLGIENYHENFCMFHEEDGYHFNFNFLTINDVELFI